MGLDMYLYKMPRYGRATAKDVSNIERYLEWLDAKEKGREYANCTFEEWCGVSEKNLPSQKTMDFYIKHYDTKYWSWDHEHKYGHKMIMQQIADWRKANAVHQWFVENVQNGEDDCEFHREVTESDLKDLRDTCKEILDACYLYNGEVVVDVDLASELLPTQGGFFFGGIEYDSHEKESLEIVGNYRNNSYNCRGNFHHPSYPRRKA